MDEERAIEESLARQRLPGRQQRSCGPLHRGDRDEAEAGIDEMAGDKAIRTRPVTSRHLRMSWEGRSPPAMLSSLPGSTEPRWSLTYSTLTENQRCEPRPALGRRASPIRRC